MEQEKPPMENAMEQEGTYFSRKQVRLKWTLEHSYTFTIGTPSELITGENGQELSDPASVVKRIRVAEDEKWVIVHYADGSHETFTDFSMIRSWPLDEDEDEEVLSAKTKPKTKQFKKTKQ